MCNDTSMQASLFTEKLATLGGRYLLQVRHSVQKADATVDQHALETKPRAVQERLQRVGGREASEGR